MKLELTTPQLINKDNYTRGKQAKLNLMVVLIQLKGEKEGIHLSDFDNSKRLTNQQIGFV